MIDTSILDPIALFLLDTTIKTTLFMCLVLFAVWLLGTRTRQNVIFRFSFSNSDVVCQRQSFQMYRNNWSNWPTVEH